MILWRNIENFIILIPTPYPPHFYYMLGGNLGSLSYGDVSMMLRTFLSLQADYEFCHLDYEKTLMLLLSRKDRNSMIINNPDQSVFLFIDRLQLEVNVVRVRSGQIL